MEVPRGFTRLRDLYWKWRIWRLDRWAERNKNWLSPPPPLDDLLERIDEEADRD